MKNDMERCQIVYDVLKTHIQFGAYRFGDVLPTMENNTENFLVSLDTIRSAYLQLEQEGYVTLSQNVGSTVIKDYGEQEIEQHVQLFFSPRKSALIDLSRSLRLYQCPVDRPEKCPRGDLHQYDGTKEESWPAAFYSI